MSGHDIDSKDIEIYDQFLRQTQTNDINEFKRGIELSAKDIATISADNTHYDIAAQAECSDQKIVPIEDEPTYGHDQGNDQNVDENGSEEVVTPDLKLIIQDQSGTQLTESLPADAFRSGNKIIYTLPPHLFIAVHEPRIVYANSPVENEPIVQQPAIQASGYRCQNEVFHDVDPNSYSAPEFEGSDNVDEEMVDLELTPSFPPVDEFRKPSDVFSEDKAIKLIKALGNAKENEYVTPADVKKLLRTLKETDVHYTNDLPNEKFKREIVEFKIINDKQPKKSIKNEKKKFPCFCCPSKFTAKDARNKHVRSHFSQVLHARCPCGIIPERMDNHKNKCPFAKSKKNGQKALQN